MLTDAILLSIIASTVTILGLLIKYTFASKCKKTSCCCGFINVERDTTHEQNSIEEIKIDMPSPKINTSLRKLQN